MSSVLTEAETQMALRLRALKRLKGVTAVPNSRLDASAALGVLYELASSSATAPAALALLHELQVNQVELELQSEELQRTRTDLEATVQRQTQIYEFSPAACLTVDRRTTMRELNLTAGDMLRSAPDHLLGRSLDSCLCPQSQRVFHAMLDRVTQGGGTEVGELQLSAASGPARRVHAAASLDPDGRHFLVVLIDLPAEVKPD
jgi:nitrogen fixation/metabolism regulation signal transduction histidine kinase